MSLPLPFRKLEPEVVKWAEEGTAGYVSRDAGLALARGVHQERRPRGDALPAAYMAAALVRRVATLCGRA